MASNEVSRKRGREEVSPPPPVNPEKVSPPPPAETEEVSSPPPEEVPPPTPAEVKPPPPEEVKPPRCKVAQQPLVPLHAASVNVADACWSVKMLHQAFLSFGKVDVHLGVQQLTHLL
jgi:hypothetical protein